jgi:hypothetical protein
MSQTDNVHASQCGLLADVVDTARGAAAVVTDRDAVADGSGLTDAGDVGRW